MQQLIKFVWRLFSPAAIGSSGEGGAAVSELIEPERPGRRYTTQGAIHSHRTTRENTDQVGWALACGQIIQRRKGQSEWSPSGDVLLLLFSWPPAVEEAPHAQPDAFPWWAVPWRQEENGKPGVSTHRDNAALRRIHTPSWAPRPWFSWSDWREQKVGILYDAHVKPYRWRGVRRATIKDGREHCWSWCITICSCASHQSSLVGGYFPATTRHTNTQNTSTTTGFTPKIAARFSPIEFRRNLVLFWNVHASYSWVI